MDSKQEGESAPPTLQITSIVMNRSSGMRTVINDNTYRNAPSDAPSSSPSPRNGQARRRTISTEGRRSFLVGCFAQSWYVSRQR
nr:hypothetical transcript [Hymenolepis microstoma]